MADLVSLTAFKVFLGVTSATEDALLDALLDEIEETLERACGRERRPFQAAETGRAELRDGTGTARLFLDYPIADITSIEIGRDPANPVETLDPADPLVVLWEADHPRIVRVDGGVWDCAGRPGVIRITYDTADDLPKMGALAIKRVAAAVYRQRGAEDVTGERTSTFGRELAQVADGDPIWQLAVDRNREISA